MESRETAISGSNAIGSVGYDTERSIPRSKSL